MKQETKSNVTNAASNRVEEIETDPQTVNNSSDEEADLSFLKRKPKCSLPFLSLKPSANHAVLFLPDDADQPIPDSYQDKWDYSHVRMPCSPLSKCIVMKLNGKKEIGSRWDLICQSLRKPIHSTECLKKAIIQYNSKYQKRWDFPNLLGLLDIIYTEDERTHFFNSLLPSMISLALDLPNICTQPLPLLKQDCDYYVTMSKKQIGCLLVNAFFCTFPHRSIPRDVMKKFNLEYRNYPDINFNRLFDAVRIKCIEKLKCLFNYFERITFEEPTGNVTFHRKLLQDLPDWQNSTQSIHSVVVKSDGLIEKEGHGMLQVDFANKFVGGGVLSLGCVQEEIRFMICPELIVSRLFVECLGPLEVLVITGVEQYNEYSGYGQTFKWEGNHVDLTPLDAWGRRYTEVVAMDATYFTNSADQLKLPCILRELNKAYCGFYENCPTSNLCAVATGNWGCGAFNGDPKLKFIIQLMVASEAGRQLLYFTFGNKALERELKILAKHFVENNLVVGDLYKILTSYCKTAVASGKDFTPTMCQYVSSYNPNEEKSVCAKV